MGNVWKSLTRASIFVHVLMTEHYPRWANGASKFIFSRKNKKYQIQTPLSWAIEFFGWNPYGRKMRQSLKYNPSVFGWKSLVESRESYKNVKFGKWRFSVFRIEIDVYDPQSLFFVYFRKACVNTYRLIYMVEILDDRAPRFRRENKCQKFSEYRPFGSPEGRISKKSKWFWTCPQAPYLCDSGLVHGGIWNKHTHTHTHIPMHICTEIFGHVKDARTSTVFNDLGTVGKVSSGAAH